MNLVKMLTDLSKNHWKLLRFYDGPYQRTKEGTERFRIADEKLSNDIKLQREKRDYLIGYINEMIRDLERLRSYLNNWYYSGWTRWERDGFNIRDVGGKKYLIPSDQNDKHYKIPE